MHPEHSTPRGIIPAVVDTFLETRLSVLLVLAAIALGIAAILVTPREEEPQIVVPMADVFVEAPGASADEIEKLVTTPLERLLWQIDGVEHVYSTSRRDSAMATVRFFVGEDREESLIKLHNAILMHRDLVPPIVSGWLVKPVEIDDVPIVNIVLYSDRYTDHELRRIGEEVYARLAEVENVSKITITGGRPREVRVELLPQRMSGLGISPRSIRTALMGADTSVTAGQFDQADRSYTLRTDAFLTSAREVGEIIVGVFEGRPVYLRDIAEITDGAAEATTYTRIGFSTRTEVERNMPEELRGREYPAVTLAVAKKKGTNAVDVARSVKKRMETLGAEMLPSGVSWEITRDYGQTAQDKVNNLLSSLGLAILTVVALLTFTLGRREAAVVALAVPVSFALALFVNHLFGYTINRVTLFALILSLGLVVDDPITNVDNIQRHIRLGRLPARGATLFAVREVLPPVIMSTLAIIVSFTPMFFITGMMGPYMAPMAANVPLTVIFSTVAALTVVPWLSHLLLRKDAGKDKGDTGDDAPDANVPEWLKNGYSAIVSPFLDSPTRRSLLWIVILLLLIASCALAVFRFVPLKMLPFDNKNEFQILVDMPEGTSLETTDRALSRFTDYLAAVSEVENYTTYSGTASPMDFNGMVRHYFIRKGPHLADIRVNLADKSRREMQSHAVVLRLRPDLERIANEVGADIKIVEVPPGPPVLSTLVAEIYGTPDRNYNQIITGAQQVATLMRTEPLVTDVDTSAEAEREFYDFELDRDKAALHGVTAQGIACALHMAISGDSPATLHLPGERTPLPVVLRLPRVSRSSITALSQMPVAAANAPTKTVELAELGTFVKRSEDQPIHHKNLRRVAYVYGEMAGRSPVEAVIDLMGRMNDYPLPPGINAEWAGEGEWEITLSVFRDLGIAFGAALIGIFILLVIQTKSFSMPALIMSAIPLTIIGIMPGFWLLNVFFASDVGNLPNPIFFTATSMIGMIALGGIVIRNSLVLIEFIEGARREGLELRRAILASGAVRLRPIVLTALTTALGAWPITLDPIFSGLAWALITGLFASTAFTLIVIPVAYYGFVNRD